MTKRDINYIKYIKPHIKDGERKARDSKLNSRYQKLQREEFISQQHQTFEDNKQKEICKLAATMSCEERLKHYFITMDGTYLGNGCNWSLLTKMGRDKFGKIIGSIL